MFYSAVRSLSVTSRALSGAGKRLISVQSLLHGSPEAREEGELAILQHSKLVGRGKYVHGFEVHRVKPHLIEEYKKAAERYYVGIKDDPELGVKLTGSWETLVGEQDLFLHILEYENYAGYDKTTQLIRESKDYTEAYKTMLPFVNSRSSQLNQEFGFFPTAPPHAQGGLFELRSYQLKPGTLLEWETTWRSGIEARRKFVAPVGAWFSQIGRLHQTHHLWQYPDLQARKDLREKAWQIDGWAETVSKTSKLAETMDSYILSPLSFSPLK
ncbi:NIPSNAP-domain-containing protein [Coprinopsis marcescibilis]|uniref:NIPSNAP-domain-containing protein n=1 Tax=Coprinopsis marcescibilis TaxID=230819 RepID=A0A5C3LD16_COPMA|nr:NIPSNAP-domain-containing protein [Coprinopsis marcescibilis]